MQRVACPQIVRPRVQSTLQNFTYSISATESHVESTWSRLQTNQRRRVKRSTERRSNKTADSSIPLNLLFSRLTLLRKFQTVCDSCWEKSLSSSRSVNPSPHRTPFSRNSVSKFDNKIAIYSNTKSFIRSVYLDHLYLLVKNMFWEVILMNISVGQF